MTLRHRITGIPPLGLGHAFLAAALSAVLFLTAFASATGWQYGALRMVARSVVYGTTDPAQLDTYNQTRFIAYVASAQGQFDELILPSIYNGPLSGLIPDVASWLLMGLEARGLAVLVILAAGSILPLACPQLLLRVARMSPMTHTLAQSSAPTDLLACHRRATRMLAAATPLLAIANGWTAWYVLFDRSFTGRPLTDWFVPSLPQALGCSFGTVIVHTFVGSLMLRRFLRRASEKSDFTSVANCPRCGYPRTSDALAPCSECGSTIEAALHQTRNRSTVYITLALCVAVGLSLLTRALTRPRHYLSDDIAAALAWLRVSTANAPDTRVLYLIPGRVVWLTLDDGYGLFALRGSPTAPGRAEVIAGFCPSAQDPANGLNWRWTVHGRASPHERSDVAVGSRLTIRVASVSASPALDTLPIGYDGHIRGVLQEPLRDAFPRFPAAMMELHRLLQREVGQDPHHEQAEGNIENHER